ncbi:hypothetical protein [Natrinema limicola]|uniref:Uncharacterized protein n=1 Tax=Natrinema limicola JCM 13563 TaxID=1230457 RepID=M0CVM0_9EURY|nr:hypothetical protein [Natrinema limicola]ELZ25929.1 hypothetical protein C476_00722 [Natrinema limicola JCM 13563]
MNQQQLRPLYLLGIAASAYALWYFVTAGSNLYAIVFGLVTVTLVVRLRKLTADS